ncbi:sia-alpha-2,3-Gal-beta-1,4-GlcNAc-R:alpha 2,8-sialyltransferase-like [Lytechinus pictus]|uniref:sia-alpha-2,3-Gal-beta-1,4-GlcNAc-R:alpha 2,8-sialyltransferase-like n=1 Tax=Lytechinus pictus TaxID=7653 RepID=UPI0030B9F615
MTRNKMDPKKFWVLIIVLVVCTLTLLLHKSAKVMENGPILVHLEPSEHLANMFGDTRLLDNPDTHNLPKPQGFEKEDHRSTADSKENEEDLLTYVLHGSSTAKDVSQSEGNDTVNDDSSIADIWREEEEDDGIWRIFEEEYRKIDWKRNKDGFNQWRTELSMYGVDSRNGFLITQESVEVKQVLPFYLSTQHTYTVSEYFLSLIPKSSPYSEKSLGRCAVVGNSGNLKNSGCGREIDAADYVFRCNVPPLVEYENDVGLKTNLTSMNPSMLDTKEYGTISITREIDYPYNMVLEPYSGVILLPCFSHFFYLRKCLKAIKQYYLKKANMTFLHPDNFITIWEYWKDRQLTNLPSTGFYLINVAATLCDSVDVFGFWPFDKTSLRSGVTEHVMYHYYEEGKWRPIHDMYGEFGQLFELHRGGVLKMHLGNCTSS